MGVLPERKALVIVAQRLRDGSNVRAVGDRDRRKAMPELVRMHVLNAITLAEAVEVPRWALRVHGLNATLAGENVLAYALFLHLFRSELLQERHDIGAYAHCADLAALWRVHVDALLRRDPGQHLRTRRSEDLRCFSQGFKIIRGQISKPLLQADAIIKCFNIIKDAEPCLRSGLVIFMVDQLCF